MTTNRTLLTTIALAAATMALSACGGRAGSGLLPSGPAGSDLTGAAIADGAQPAGGHTTATGRLYSDPAGKPIGNELVRVYPWTPCTKTSPHARACPDAVYTTHSRSNGTFVLANIPNGRYLLVIGDDVATDVTYATIHDQIVLAGGKQRLVAPTLPKEPVGAPYTIGVPSIERSGNYRISKLNQYERACSIAYGAQRTQRGLPAFVTDEWLLENSRTANVYLASKFTKPTDYGIKVIAPGGDFTIGSTDCTSAAEGAYQLTTPKSTVKALRDPRAMWIGAIWYLADAKKDYSGYGIAGYPIDPRVKDTPGYPWP